MISAFRRLAIAALLIVPAACHDFSPAIDLEVDYVSDEVVSTLGTDSVTGYLASASTITFNGVIYAAIDCDGLTYRAERPYGILRVTIQPDPARDCPRVRRRVAYRLTMLNLDPGTYRAEIIHHEPESAVRGRRVVFAGQVTVR